MRYILFLSAAVLILWGCSKSSFNTTPSLKFKSVNGTVIPSGGLVKFTLEVTDAEGDIQDTLYVEKVVPRCDLSNLIEYREVPLDVPLTRNFQGDLIITYANGSGISGFEDLNIEPKCDFNDTCYFRFMIKDKANHKSDTLTTPTIVLQK